MTQGLDGGSEADTRRGHIPPSVCPQLRAPGFCWEPAHDKLPDASSPAYVIAWFLCRSRPCAQTPCWPQQPPLPMQVARGLTLSAVSCAQGSGAETSGNGASPCPLTPPRNPRDDEQEGPQEPPRPPGGTARLAGIGISPAPPPASIPPATRVPAPLQHQPASPPASRRADTGPRLPAPSSSRHSARPAARNPTPAGAHLIPGPAPVSRSGATGQGHPLEEPSPGLGPGSPAGAGGCADHAAGTRRCGRTPCLPRSLPGPGQGIFS